MNIIQLIQDFDSSDYMMYEKMEIYGLHIWRRKQTDSGEIQDREEITERIH